MSRVELDWTVASVALAILVGLGVTLLVRRTLVRLPEDYFLRPPVPQSWLRSVLARLGGAVCVIAGVAMLFLPGPGIATILVGLALLDLPLNRTIAIALLRRPKLALSVTEMRRRVGKAPFHLPPLDGVGA